MMKNFILARAKEPSTWRGFFMILGAFGVVIAPGVQEGLIIVATALASSGFIGMVTPDATTGK